MDLVLLSNATDHLEPPWHALALSRSHSLEKIKGTEDQKRLKWIGQSVLIFFGDQSGLELTIFFEILIFAEVNKKEQVD